MSSTPVHPLAEEKMRLCLGAHGSFANPLSIHLCGREAAAMIDRAACQIAAAVGCKKNQVYWTSGATEANFWAIKTAHQYSRQGKHIVSMATEHASVLSALEMMRSEGFEVSYLKPEPSGQLDLNCLKEALRPDTVMVSLMMVNNETGVIQPIEEAARIIKKHGAIFHVDAAQGPGKMPVNFQAMGMDLMTLSAHKVYGPKGVGALIAAGHVHLGGWFASNQRQKPLRPGTPPTHQIVGMGEAFQNTVDHLEQSLAHIRLMRDSLWDGIKDLPGIFLNGDFNCQVPHCINFGFEHIDARALLYLLKDLMLSQGSACLGERLEPSHVLRSMGLGSCRANRSIRLSFGTMNQRQDIPEVIEKIKKSVEYLDKIAVKK